MSKKSSSKKSQQLWFNCEKCSTILAKRDCDSHENVCPITIDNENQKEFQKCSFIKNNILFTNSFDKKPVIEDIKDLSDKHLNNLIFVSETAIKLCEFYIGETISITSTESLEKIPIIRVIWPVPDRFLTTIFFAEDDFEQNWTDLKGHQLKIEKLSSDPIPIDELVLELLKKNEIDLPVAKIDMEKFLKVKMKNLIYTIGNKFKINFYNKDLEFQLKSFKTQLSTNKDLNAKFEQLMLTTKTEFLKITHATKIIIKSEVESILMEEKIQERISLDDIGGLDNILKNLEENLRIALGFQIIPDGVEISRGILLHGPSGCGKTLLTEVLANRFEILGIQIIRINTSEIFSKFFGETEKNLVSYFDKAFTFYPSPTLILIEDINNLCPKNDVNEVVKRVSIALLNLIDTLHTNPKGNKTFILATTGNIENLNSGLRRCGRLDTEIEISPPSPTARYDILNKLLKKIENKLSHEDLKRIADITHGFVGSDLSNLIYKSVMVAINDNRNEICIQDIDNSLVHVKPSAMRQVLIECPNVHWSDIGGQQDLKLKLKQAIEWPLLYPEKFKKLGIKPPRGLLMFGPPGCSKTMIAKALATESKLNFLSIKGPELFSMWVGESERAVREVFRKARQVAPAIIFFDEIDAIGGERSSDGQSVKERVLTQLLTELDGVDALNDVTIVAATNRPDMIDKALLRPGRIDRIVYVGLPEAKTRHEIFKIKLKNMPIDENVDLDDLVNKTDGYSGAEIQAVCHEAALKALEENFNAEYVEWKHFEIGLSSIKPRTSKELLKMYDEYLK